MVDFRERFRVEAPKGPYVGYGVWDAESGRFLTQVDLTAEHALTVAASLMAAAAPRDVRRGALVRPIVPPVAIRADSHAGILAAWAARPTGWMGFVLLDGEMRAAWMPGDGLTEP